MRLLYDCKLSVNIFYTIVNVDGWFLLKEAVCSQSGEDVRGKIEYTAVPLIHKLRNIFQFVIYRFNDKPLA